MTRSKSGSDKNLVDELKIDGHPATSSCHFPFDIINSFLPAHFPFPSGGVRYVTSEVEESR